VKSWNKEKNNGEFREKIVGKGKVNQYTPVSPAKQKERVQSGAIRFETVVFLG